LQWISDTIPSFTSAFLSMPVSRRGAIPRKMNSFLEEFTGRFPHLDDALT
jgi:hypothetical protein